MKNKILVAGASGRLGQIVTQILVSNRIFPGVLVRDLSKATLLFGQEVSYHIGDVRDINTLHPAMKNVDAIISCIGSRTPVGKNCPRRVDYEGVANLVTAACSQNVRRFILISSIAVTNSQHPLNGFGKVLDWKLKGEDILRQSCLDYAIIRPGGLIDTPGGKHTLLIDQGDRIMGTISREDVAAIAIQTLLFPKSLKVTFEVIESDRQNNSHWFEAIAALTPDVL